VANEWVCPNLDTFRFAFVFPAELNSDEASGTLTSRILRFPKLFTGPVAQVAQLRGLSKGVSGCSTAPC
jgi:hypothetical protein